MKLTSRVKVLAVALFSMATFSGCALTSPADIDKSVYTADESVNIKNQDLVENLKIDKIQDFYDTSKFALTTNRIANLNDEDFREALRISLSSAGLYSDNGDYSISAVLTEPDIGFFTNRSYKREPVVTYTIKDNMGDIIYNEDIKSIGRSTPFFIHSEYKHNKITAEKAYKDNFRQLIEDLSTLQ